MSDVYYIQTPDGFVRFVPESRHLAELAKALERIAKLEAGYAEAIQDIQHWADYAGSYFRKKHNLEEVVAAHRATLAPPDRSR